MWVSQSGYVRELLKRTLHQPNTRRVINAFGFVFLLFAAATSYLASTRQGQDFAVLYATAIGIATGAPIYSEEWQQAAIAAWGLPLPKNVPYPPSAGFVVLPFATFPFSLAKILWFLAMVSAITWGVRSLVRLIAPSAPTIVWLFTAGAVLLSACVRWGMTPLQPAPLMLGLLAALVAALYTSQHRVAFLIVASVTALKFTVAFPFVALFVLHNRYRALIGVGALVGALNVLGFLRVGGWSAVNQYRLGIQGHEAYGTVDSPDPWTCSRCRGWIGHTS
jgi:hypothetical protein